MIKLLKRIYRTEHIRRPVRHMWMAAGMDLYLPSEDRRVLEQTILPGLVAQAGVKNVLFAGCGWYTRGYRRFFDEDHYWTIDIDPEKERYGARRHIVDSLANLNRHFSPGELDAIICNGVFGWGLDAKDDVEKAFEACHACLRDEGIFILGWNDIPERRPFPLSECEALEMFRPCALPPLETSTLATATDLRHMYNFYRK